jgi:hypothetical protein
MREVDSYLKNVGLAIAIQLLLVVVVWVLVFLFSPALDSLLGIIIYFYWPILYLVGGIVNPGGELGSLLLGLPIGIVVYGIVAGLVIFRMRRTH